MTREPAKRIPVRFRRSAASATVPSEAWDNAHPDHDWWVNGRGWCYDPDCPQHDYGPPAAEHQARLAAEPKETP